MKKLLLAVFIFAMITGCNQQTEMESTTAENNEWKDRYSKNLATLKSVFSNFQQENISNLSNMIADDATWNSPAYGDTISTKQHWMDNLKYYVDNWDNIRYESDMYLPGVDTTTQQFDGSVRTYGTWVATHSSGKTTSVNFYGTYDFNDANKITSASEFFDVGGLMNAVSNGNQ